MKKKETVWIVSQYAGAPGIGMQYRQFQFAKELKKLGHEVVIISGSFSHLYRHLPTTNSTFTHDEIEGVPYLWVKNPKYAKSISIGRFWNMLIFAWRLLFLPTHELPQPTLVVVSSPSMLPIKAALKWKKKFNTQVFFEVRDIWPLTLQELGGLSNTHPLVSFMRHYEKMAYTHADKVISLLPNAQAHYEAGGMAPEKFVYIPNGIEIGEGGNGLERDGEGGNGLEKVGEGERRLDKRLARRDTLLKDIDQEKVIVGYGGSLGTANALDYLLDAAELLVNETKLHFVLVGKGDDVNHLKSRAKDLPNVSIYPPVEKKEFLALLDQFDICYLGLRPDSLFRFGVSPNKLFDYMQAAKPIIFNIDSGNKPVDEAQCGISVIPGDTGALCDAILALLRMSEEERNKLGQNGKNFALANHTYPILVERLLASMYE